MPNSYLKVPKKTLAKLVWRMVFLALVVVVQGCWGIAEQNNNCVNATFLKQSECEHSNSSCRNLLQSGWREIKCNPFVFGAPRGSCSKWCKHLYSFIGENEPPLRLCLAKFECVSTNPVAGTSNIAFRVVSCGTFVFHIRLINSTTGATVFTTHPTHNTTGGNNNSDITHPENTEDSQNGGTNSDASGPENTEDLQNGGTNSDICGPENIVENAKEQFRTSIKSIWSEYSLRRDKSSKDKKVEDTVFASFRFESSILSFARKRLGVTSPELIDVDEDLNFRVRRNVLQRGDDFLFNGSNRGNFIKIPSANLDRDFTVLGLEYSNLAKLFSNYSADTEGDNKTKILDSVVMSAVIDPPPNVLTENITLVFKNAQVNRKKRICVFWRFSEENFGSWSSKGCQTKMISDHHTECVCNHLTHFAVLMNFIDDADDRKFFNQDKTRSSDEHDKILTLLTRVGMTLSLTGVILTVISYLQLTDKNSALCHIRVSLTSCIGAGHIIFFAGIDSTGNQAACVAVAALMQYFLMASFCWMLVEGIYIYLFVVKVYNITDQKYRYHGFCWGLPAIIVVVCLGIATDNDGIETFVNDESCWMSSSNNIIWIFVSFVGLIAIINVMILVRVIKEVTTIQLVKDSQTEQIRLGVRACVVLAPLLGVTWLIGFLAPLHIAFSYIFVILNSTQGLFIFFFHCLGNSEIGGRFKRRVQKLLPDAFNQRPGDNRGNSQARQSHRDSCAGSRVISGP